MIKEKDIVYKVINLGKTGKQRSIFFEWALSHNLFKRDESTSFTSRMKLVYTNQLHGKEQVSAVIAFDHNKPVGIVLCEDTVHQRALYKRDKNKESKELIGEASLMGFLSFYVLPSHRKKGIASKLMDIIEIERAPYFIEHRGEGYPVLLFEAIEGALNIIKKSKHSYPVDCTIHQIIFRDKLKVLEEHVSAVLENNKSSMYYSNPLIHTKKEVLGIDEYTNKKNIISKITSNELINFSPIKEKEIKAEKIVKKIPTLKPRIKV